MIAGKREARSRTADARTSENVCHAEGGRLTSPGDSSAEVVEELQSGLAPLSVLDADEARNALVDAQAPVRTAHVRATQPGASEQHGPCVTGVACREAAH